MSIIVPAVLPKSKEEFDETLARFANFPSVTRIQIDVVDGRLASPASWPVTEPGALHAMHASGELLPHLDRIEYEIDLMCHDPLPIAQEWLLLGAMRLTFHAESTTNLTHFLSDARRQLGEETIFGLALNIATDLAIVEDSLSQVQYVQYMGIARIGRQGQPFDERVYNSIKAFRSEHADTPVQVDGGVALTNAKKLLGLGVSNLIVGSGILKAPDPAVALQELEALESPYGV